MNKGKIVARGTPDELIAQHGHGTRVVLAGAGAEGLRELAARGIAAKLENSDVVVHVPTAADVKGTLAKLAALDVPLREIYTRRDTLEDVFLRLVGARMREGVLAE
jgi:ABC-type multidrug transport system ATPase subunit